VDLAVSAYHPYVVIDDPGLARLLSLPAGQAHAELLACCASPEWARAMVAARPFTDRADLLARGAAELARLSWDEIRVAVDAHPRIGERGGRPANGTGSASGTTADGTADDADDHEAAWSAREQSGMAGASEAVRAGLVEANLAYEKRFGHVFLIFASGRSDVEMLAAARQRLAQDEETERAVVRAELGRIVALRLRRLLDERLAIR
jgi:2-oxo-4-hydroxy-4-carboxy-5-ureidoimidazoline decarboxylase